MRVLLVKPHNLSDHIQPSLGLGHLATAVRNKHEVTILDCIKEGINIESLPRHIHKFNPDILGIQCYTFDLDFVRKSFLAARRIDPDIISIVGGPHPTAVPEETMGYLEGLVDFAFQGESEVGFPLLLDMIERKAGYRFNEVPGLVWRDNGRVIVNGQAYPENLDALGLPAWDLICPQTYPQAQHGAFFKKFPIAPIMITRGCPFACTFCAGGLISGKKIRKRGIENVLNEIKVLYDSYGIREFHIVDDNFTADKIYAKELIRKLIDLRLDISLATPNGIRVDSLDAELLQLLKSAGLYVISLGIESGSDRVLDLMKKNLTVDKIRSTVDMIRKVNIDIAGFFIIGFPEETIGDIIKTIRLSLELDLVRANYFTYLPFPGTESYKKLKENGELNNVDWTRFYFMSAPYAPLGFTQKKLRNLQRKAFLRFYLRPKILLKNILCIRSPAHLYFIFRRFFRWILMS